MLKKILFFALLLNVTTAFSSPSLVGVDWLEKNMSSSSIRVIDMSGDTQYQRFHIPGASYLPYSAINTRTKQGVSFSVGSKQITKILGLLGIESQHHVVIYDDMGGLHASRLFWELEKIGHKKISLLNGGLVKWILSGKKVTATATEAKATRYLAKDQLSRNNVANIDDILKGNFNDKNILLDVRSKDEYVGHPRYPRSGHIPNAKWWEWQQAVNFEKAFSLQKKSTLKNQLENLGITQTDTPITLYCQSAHRASHSYFTLRNLGFSNVKIYDGSMSEYSKIKSAPLVKGTKP